MPTKRKRHTTVDDVVVYDLRCFHEDLGDLVPIQGDQDVNYEIRRAFFVTKPKAGCVRGKHAHHKCEQTIICISGRLTVKCFDGKETREYELDEPNKAVYIPTGIWSEETYHTEDTVLLCLASHRYATADYIRDLEEFTQWKNS